MLGQDRSQLRRLLFQRLECGEHRPRTLPVVPENRAARERKFITATEIGRFGDIAVMAQIQRNAGIPVTLAGS
jgi:hypothetical protein